MFVRTTLIPYLSQVFTALVDRGSKDYLPLEKLKLYLQLPPLLSEAVTRLINENGDERIDHDEFVKFFLNVISGPLRTRLEICFKCYDFDGDESISMENIALMLS